MNRLSGQIIVTSDDLGPQNVAARKGNPLTLSFQTLVTRGGVMTEPQNPTQKTFHLTWAFVFAWKTIGLFQENPLIGEIILSWLACQLPCFTRFSKFSPLQSFKMLLVFAGNTSWNELTGFGGYVFLGSIHDTGTSRGFGVWKPREVLSFTCNLLFSNESWPPKKTHISHDTPENETSSYQNMFATNPRDPITLSEDHWGLQSPPKCRVYRFHYHSQKVIQHP